MSASAENAGARRTNWRMVSLLVLGMGLGLLVFANAHLVYVALDSQPDCVPHAKATSGDGTFRAARSSC